MLCYVVEICFLFCAATSNFMRAETRPLAYWPSVVDNNKKEKKKKSSPGHKP